MANQHTKAKDMAKAREDAIIETARKRAKLAQEAEQKMRAEAQEDLRFRAGQQWPRDVEAKRLANDEPCLTINTIPQFEKQVTNDMRQSRPSINVDPVDDDADPETAEVIQGLIRHIEYASNAAVAYERGGTSAVRGGFGFIRVITDYVDSESFDQEIRIKSVRDPMMVYLDPNAQEPDGSDAKWGFVYDWMTKEDFQEAYPEALAIGAGGFDQLAAAAPDWMNGDEVRVAEYYWTEYTDSTIYELEDGSIVEELPEGVKPKRTRKVKKPQIKWAKITGTEILEPERDIVFDWVPIVPVYGDEIVVDGQVIREGLIRNARDVIRMANYWASKEAQAITLAPIAPYIMAEGQQEGHEDEWTTANLEARAYLTYKPTTIEGNLAPPPQRTVQEPAIAAISHARMACNEDVKRVVGIYDPSLGNREAAQSGIAIRSLQSQGQMANFHFPDNQNRAICQVGRIILSGIPKVYDTARIERILGEDGTAKTVKINQPSGEFDEQGMEKIFDMTVGKYDVVLSTGPSYQTQRQEEAVFMEKLIQSYPPTMQIAGDLVLAAQNSPGAKAMSERFKKTLPPGLADDEDPKKAGAPQLPPQVQQQLEQSGQMIEQLTAKVHELADALESKQMEQESKSQQEMAKAQLDAQTKLEIARMDNETKLLTVQAQITAAGALPEIQAQLAELQAQQEDVAQLALHLSSLYTPALAPVGAEPTPTAGEPAGQE